MTLTFPLRLGQRLTVDLGRGPEVVVIEHLDPARDRIVLDRDTDDIRATRGADVSLAELREVLA